MGESTLETSSSESHRPVRRVKQGPPEDRTPREAPSKHLSTTPPGQFMGRHSIQRQPRPAPPPEDDILYQWRLARKMERAQERAVKWGPAKGTISLGTSRPRFAHVGAELEPCGLSSAVRIPQPTLTQRPGLQVSAPSVTPGVLNGTENLSSRTQTTFSTPMAVTSDREGTSSQMIPSHISITSQPQAAVSSGQLSQLGTEMSSGTHEFVPSIEPSPAVTMTRPEILGQVHTLVVEQDHFEHADVPSHMHLSCDILPCPHQRALIEKGRSDKTIKLPLSSPVIESMQEELHIAEKDISVERKHKPQRNIIRESHEKGQIQRLPRKEMELKTRKTGVVSERLFSTPQSSNSSLSGSDHEGLGPRLAQEQYHSHAPEGESSSESEFSDDEVLKMLRQKARSYREQLKQIDSILNQQAAGRPSS
ncbi:hypothetical protein OS493_018279 [Desmophyllum pertusum]|uniref:Uncharacterized protein n=1 Tax=Desmophyllum pertusum TaxID=174260 RepID=A0A9W9YBW7_9CNID|nr:hypothetical protein OS493_018279 [Desmophyllum pertusum]